MVPERDRKEVYDDVLFFLAKKEKVTVTGKSHTSCFCFLTDPGHSFPQMLPGPRFLLGSWCGTYTSLSLLWASNPGRGQRKESGLLCPLCPFPSLGT